MSGKNKLGQEPAFPITEEQMDRIEIYPEYAKMAGMSKRFYAACASMQGILATRNYFYQLGDLLDKNDVEKLVSNAYEFTDELLKKENG